MGNGNIAASPARASFEYLYNLSETGELTKQSLPAIHARVAALIASAGAIVRPVLRLARPDDPHRERPQLFGSGVLLRVQERSFLLSASHVLGIASSEPLYIGARDEIVPLGGTVLPRPTPPHGDYEKDPIDIAVMELDRDTAERLNDRPFLTPDDFATEDRSEPGHLYVIAGNAYSRSDTDAKLANISAPLLVLVGEGREHKWYSHFGAHPHTHLLVRHDKEHCVGPDGVRRTSPSVKGVSGGPCWRLSLDDGRTRPQLAGVLLSHHSNPTKTLVAAKVVLHIAALGALSPALAAALPRSQIVNVNVRRERGV